MKIDPRYNRCRCGNLKYSGSRRCKECFLKNNRRQLSRLSTKWDSIEVISKKIISTKKYK